VKDVRDARRDQGIVAGGDLGDSLLCVALPERSLPMLARNGHRIGAERFAHRNQADIFGIAAARLGGVCNAQSYGLQVGADCVHNFKQK